VTPSSLITGIITELGVARAAKPEDAVSAAEIADGVIDLTSFLRARGVAESKLAKAVIPTTVPPGFQRLDESILGSYVLSVNKLYKLLGYTTESVADAAGALKVTEVGDGNINFVYIIESPFGKKLVLKQALPYVRVSRDVVRTMNDDMLIN
jgi:hypothetical protein